MKIPLVLILLLLLIITACSVQDDLQQTADLLNKSALEDVEQTDEIETDSIMTLESCYEVREEGRNADMCFLYNAKKTADYTLCEEIVLTRPECYQEIAISEENEAICEELTDPTAEDYQIQVMIQTCKYMVNATQQVDATAVTDTGSVAECDNLERKDTIIAAQCYSQVALTENNYTLCENIEGDNQQLRITCFQNVAIKLQDKSICDKMTVPDFEYLDVAKNQCLMLVENAIQQ